MAILILLFIATVLLSFSNGANDNFKGVATLYGSGTASYKTAITWATFTTGAGCIASIFLAQALLKKFSGKGLVPDSHVNSETFLLAVALGAGLTVILATRLGFPISTTHGLLGALIGSGFVGASSSVNFGALGKGFVLPLLLSPVLAALLGALLYFGFHSLRVIFRIPKEWCVCIGAEERAVVMPGSSVMAMKPLALPVLAVGDCTIDSCAERYAGKFIGIDSQKAVDTLHFLSAGFVGFSRGLNDAPKIAAMMLLITAVPIWAEISTVSLAMAIGGLLGARRVAETMSHKITTMNHGQAFSSNLAAGILVFLASTFGLPVSTTHVTVGSLSGIGVLTGQANIKVVGGIVLSWIVTLPCAAAISATIYFALTKITG